MNSRYNVLLTREEHVIQGGKICIRIESKESATNATEPQGLVYKRGVWFGMGEGHGSADFHPAHLDRNLVGKGRYPSGARRDKRHGRTTAIRGRMFENPAHGVDERVRELVAQRQTFCWGLGLG